MKGVEIGPFYAPLAPKAEGWDVVVVDYANTERLRDIAHNHDAESIRNAADRIEEVDVVWQGENLDAICLPLSPSGYDFLLASHVIEHAPDFIGFISQASRLLKPAGVISLAVPDLRRCFDLFKTPSLTAEVLAAHREKRKLHSPENMFEAWAYSVGNKGEGAWVKNSKFDLAIYEGYLADSWNRYQAYVAHLNDGTQEYVDAHAWHFTPASFELVMLELNALGLVDFHIASLTDTIASEFLVRLERGALSLSPAELTSRRLELMIRRFDELRAEAPTLQSSG